MKRGINDKNMSPMFPRLNVNDTEKGGPRAPPRNKMALYEQLTIPSHRFSGSNLISNNAPIPTLSEKGSFLPHQQTHTLQATDKNSNQYTNQLVQQEQKKKQENEEFRVPVCQNHQNKANQLKKSNGSNNSMGSLSNVTQDHAVDSQKQVIKSSNHVANCDDLSENSMIDSISGLNISPDDVVGVIGQKHFWKARIAIVNQQRVFNVQLFELHRLIKVQRLIAEIPQSMVENDPVKVSPIKKIPKEYILKASTNVPKVKDYEEKSKDENPVEKTSISSVQNSSGSTGTGYPLPPSDPQRGPWSLSQQPGHQWLIPVFSPSEGLIYKPYPGPTYMAPPPPPAQHHYQWLAGFHFPPPAHGYFPPYGENMSPFNMQYQSSPCNNSEVQVSTASSTSERAHSRDALSLFPTGPTMKGAREPTRAIRVVPRNASSATESVTRIFQFIQEERKKQDKGNASSAMSL